MKVDFDPLLCFAKGPGQTASQVFDDVQERIRTLVGVGLSRLKKDDVSLLAMNNEVSRDVIDEMASWQRSSILFDTQDFEKFACPLSLSLSDVMGSPVISDDDRKRLQKILPKQDGGLDPIRAYVVLAALDRLDGIVKDRRDWGAVKGVKTARAKTKRKEAV